jgi:hypothetical protein
VVDAIDKRARGIAPGVERRPRVLGRKEEDELARATRWPRAGWRYALMMRGTSVNPKLDVASSAGCRMANVPTEAGGRGRPATVEAAATAAAAVWYSERRRLPESATHISRWGSCAEEGDGGGTADTGEAETERRGARAKAGRDLHLVRHGRGENKSASRGDEHRGERPGVGPGAGQREAERQKRLDADT